MFEQRRPTPGWLPYLDLTCATLAGGLWYASQQWWPLLVALVPWVIRFVLTRRLTRRTLFDLPLALFLLTALIGIWAAFDRELAWGRFWMIVGAVFIFYALVNAEPAGSMRVWFLALLGAAAAAYFLLVHDWDAYAPKIEAVVQLGRALQSPLPSLPGRAFNPNIVGATIAMTLPFAGLVAAQTGRRLLSVPKPKPAGLWLAFAVGLGSLILAAFGLVMTVSRSAWLATVGALLLAGIWAVAGRLGSRSLAHKGWIFLGWLVLGLGAVLVVITVWPGGTGALVGALPGPDNIQARAELLRKSLTLIHDYPFIGAGLESFQMVYSTYAMLIHVGFSLHAHNVLVDMWIEQGLPALLILVWIYALFARAFWYERSHGSSRQRRWEIGAAALSLLVIFLDGLGDSPLYKTRAVLFFFVPLAFAGWQPRQQAELDRRWAKLALPLAMIALLGALLVWRRPLLSLVFSNLGAVHQTQAELGVYSWPEWPIQDAVRQEVDLGRAIAEFERALDLDPRNATANRRLGMIELSLGEYEDALAHLEMAYAEEPGSVTTRQLYGEALIVNGRVDEGRALWAGVNTEQGQLRLRLYWYKSIGDTERAAWVQQAMEGQ